MPMAVIIIVAVAAAALVVIVVAPWRRVRAESTLPPDVQARLLLGETPSDVAGEAESRTEPNRSTPGAQGQAPHGEQAPPQAG